MLFYLNEKRFLIFSLRRKTKVKATKINIQNWKKKEKKQLKQESKLLHEIDREREGGGGIEKKHKITGDRLYSQLNQV